MKILYVIDTLNTGGAEKSLLEILSRFRSITPVVATIFDKPHDLMPLYRKAGIEVLELKVNPGNRFWLFEARKKITGVMEQIKPAIVHAHLFNGEMAARFAKRKDGPILVGAFVSDCYVKDRFKSQGLLANCKLWLYKHIDAFTARRVDYFTSVTQSIAYSNARALSIPLDKIRVLNRGRSIDKFVVKHPAAAEAPFRYICVARLLKRKGLVDLIQAAEQLKARGRSFVVNIAGDGPDGEALRQIVHEAGLDNYVQFLGNRSDVPQLLGEHHCFVFPSHYEGAGGALIEAMLAAKPIVATNIPVFVEQLKYDNTGLLFRIMDPKDLADKMEWMMDHYTEGVQMGLNAREVAVNSFDIEKIARQYEEYYLELVDRRRKEKEAQLRHSFLPGSDATVEREAVTV